MTRTEERGSEMTRTDERGREMTRTQDPAVASPPPPPPLSSLITLTSQFATFHFHFSIRLFSLLKSVWYPLIFLNGIAIFWNSVCIVCITVSIVTPTSSL